MTILINMIKFNLLIDHVGTEAAGSYFWPTTRNKFDFHKSWKNPKTIACFAEYSDTTRPVWNPGFCITYFGLGIAAIGLYFKSRK